MGWSSTQFNSYSVAGKPAKLKVGSLSIFCGAYSGAGLIYQSGSALRVLLELGSYWRASLIRSFTVINEIGMAKLYFVWMH